MIRRLLHRLLFVVQLVAVVLFIVFEEIIWEGIAEPIYRYIHGLRILQRLQGWLNRLNRYLLLGLFLVLLVGVEGAGLTAGVLAVRGHVVSAALLYGMKIPIAAFTFWMFHATESRLLSFEWFRWAYEQIVALFAWIKTREIYQSARTMFAQIKQMLRALKARYFSGENTLTKRFRRLYRAIKRSIKR